MSEEYLGLLGMVVVGVALAFAVRLLAKRLRRNTGGAQLVMPPSETPAATPTSSSRYFFLAVVTLMLHAGSFYFYLWAASAQAVGLVGLMVMLGVGMCLIVGVFYSWARGAVSYAIETESEIRAD